MTDSTPAFAAERAPERERLGMEFHGDAAEYFRIWIVNIALTVVTLGVYSAWAKVRNKQYFYGNTRLAGASFEYTANPISILKGRLIVLGAFAAYQLAAHFQPVLAVIIALALVPVVPWVVIKAVGFNLRYSAYRGLRFHFDGRYWEAFRVYVLWTVGSIASLGLAYPFVAWRRKRFLVERSRFGRSPFTFGGEVGWFYLVYIVGGVAFSGVVFVGMLLLTGGLFLAAATTGAGVEGNLEEVGKELAFGVAALLYAAMLLSLIVFNAGVQAMIANHVWQHTALAGVRFDLRLNLFRVLWIHASNIAAIVASLGLLIPWAKVRTVRYRLSRFTVLASPGALESFVASERDRVTATGAELGDALDLDLGL